ncbi:MAG TPA: hypothetical protein DCZ94_11800 [Lentisphaeria bacterium]|nr:MAG: hypothetical protein A2X48_09600 [Lentisphaerae bacterium GWF2_49_21]HBC87631.1 hypothetical protein [Lentisphaeria bacterium]
MAQKKNILLAIEGSSETAKVAKEKLAGIGIPCEICAEVGFSETETHHALRDLAGNYNQSEVILTTLTEAIPDLTVLLLDTEGKVLYISSARGLNGDPVGKKQHEIFPPDIAERHLARIKHVIKTGESVTDEEILSSATDKMVIDIKLVPVRDSKGRIHQVLGIIRDKTQHMQVEQEIRRRNLIMQALAFASEIFLTDVDLSESIMKALKKLGESSELDRVYLMKSFNEDKKDYYKVIFEWCAPDIKPQIGNIKLQRLDPASTVFKRRAALLKEQNVVYGHIRDFPANEQSMLMERGIKSIALVPILEGEKLWGMMGVDSCQKERDWSLSELDALRIAASILGAAIKRKTVEDALISSTRRFEQVAEIAKEMLWEVDPRGLYTYVSSLSKNILGYEPEELIGKKYFYDLHPDAHREEFKKMSFETFKSKGSFHDLMNPALSRTGKIIWLSTNGVPILSDYGELLGYRGSDIDITDRFKAEQDRKALENQLRQAQRMESIGRLAGGVAHDFNNCLQVILGFTELQLMKTDKNSPDHSNLMEIRHAAKHATDITHQLLAFSRKQVISPKILNLNEMVSSEQKILKRLIGEDIKLDIKVDPQLKNIYADSGNMQQVIMNLVVNSRDAMPGGGNIIIRTSNTTFSDEDVLPGNEVRAGDFVCLSVSDTGAGMTRDVIEKIFEPFFTTKELDKGTGLGLAVVHGIVEQHKGWVHVYSELGRGTEFKIYIPAVETAGDDESVEDDDVWQKGSGECILLVEDEAAVRDMVCNTFRQYGYEIWEASGYKEAVYLFSHNASKFKMVVSDVVMPDGNGVELVGQLKAISPELKILLTSGYTDEKSRWNDIREHGYRFIYKPYPLKELLKIVHEILNEPAAK